jgi:cell division protein FtsB
MDHAVKEQTARFSEQMREFLVRNLNWFLAIGLALLLLQDVFGAHGLVAMRHSQQQAAATQQEIDQLNEQNRQMEDRVKSLKSDPAAIERIAREEMQLARPGEYIFKIQSKSDDAATPSSQPDIPSQKP